MILDVIDHIGVFFLAISGVLTASEKNMDFFGGYIIAFIASLGGGTLRDLLLNTNVAWMSSMSLIITVMLGATIGIFFQQAFRKMRKTFFVFDTLGMSLFTIAGLEKGLEFDQLPFVALLLGVITATFGGVIRDVLCNDIPLVFRKEVYATACISGGGIYLVGTYLGYGNSVPLLVIAMSVIVIIRTLAVWRHWHMPLVKDVFNKK
ncbi:trimeric intracellular cation channel family protein [Lishizhenia sp.]|uniref:trimeric intracellular cation channel family protein n=1 Tax=Lishizhenia sp. TaxID=2497594 RepID=UPI00299DE17A|nr:trimeric intracellular cation channel family protein [Lishizhenia sp.]MDX1446983.1 trimeric intracellular cation channel family protein [Lishizhenia sp.]